MPNIESMISAQDKFVSRDISPPILLAGRLIFFLIFILKNLGRGFVSL